MSLSEPFIRRPVMTVVLTASAVLFGVLAYTQLSVNDLPAVDYPVIQVQVDARWLHRLRDVGVDDDPSGRDLGADVAIGEDHYSSGAVRCFMSRSTSRLRVEMSS